MTPDDYNAAQFTAGQLTTNHVTELVRYWQAGHQLVADGMAGPATIGSLEAAAVKVTTPGRFLSCPLPVLPDGRRATITSSFRPADRPNHDGADWFYSWRHGDKPDFIGDHGGAGRAADGSPRWVVPTGVCAVAAAAGVVQLASDSPTGHRVWIDHGNGLRTGYFHLLDVQVAIGQHVIAGQPLGLVGDNPADNDGRHLHWEISPVASYEPMDPERYLLPADR